MQVFGKDFYLTSDGGLTWTLQAANVFTNQLSFLEIIDENRLVATYGNYFVYQTEDKGATWNNVRPTPDLIFANGLCALPDGRVWVAGQHRTLFFSEDSGANYEDIITGIKSNLEYIEFSNINKGWAAGRAGTVLRTTDGGSNWESIDTGTEFASWNILDGLIRSEDELWLVSPNGIVKTLDGGATWEYVIDDVIGGFRKLFEIEDAIFVTDYQGGVQRSTDGGMSWEDLSTNVERGTDAIYFLNRNFGLVGGSGGTVLKTTNGGDSWEPLQTEALSSAGSVLSIHIEDEQKFWIVTSALFDNIWTTEDGGQTWSSFSTPDNSYWKKIEFVNDSTAFLVGGSSAFGRVYQTLDRGETWEQLH